MYICNKFTAVMMCSSDNFDKFDLRKQKKSIKVALYDMSFFECCILFKKRREREEKKLQFQILMYPNSYGIFFNSIYNPTERVQLFIKVSFKTNGPRYLQYVFSFLVLKKPLQKIKKKQDSLLLSIFLKHPTTQKMSLMTHRHFLVPKNPSPLTLHTRYVILLYFVLVALLH